MDNMLGIFVSNDGMCYMIEMTMMEGMVYGDGSYIDFHGVRGTYGFINE